MIPGLFLNFVTTLLNGLYSILPPWSINLGTVCSSGSTTGCSGDDNSYVATMFQLMGEYDRFIPIHDAVFPILVLSFTLVVGFIAFKLIKFVLSCIPTISAGG